MPRRPSILTRATLVLTAFLVVATFLAGFLVFQGVREGLRDGAGQDMERTLDRAMGRLRDLSSMMGDDIVFLSGNAPVLAFAEALESGDTAQVADALDRTALLFESFIRSRSTYAQVRFIGADSLGTERIRFDRDASGVHAVTGEALQAKGDRDYYQAAVRNRPGQLYFSAIDLNREHGRIVVPEEPTVRAAAPVFTSMGTPAGIVVINVDMRPLFRELMGFQQRHQHLFLADGRGEVVLCADTAHMFRAERGGSYTLADVFGTDLSETAMVGEAGGDLVAVRRWDGPLDGGPYQVAVRVDTAALLSEIHAARDRSLLLTGGVALVFALLGLLFTRAHTRQLDRLADQMERYAAGDPVVTLPEGRRDEVGRLADSLRHMQERIDQRVHELEQARAEAERSEQARRDLLANMSHEVRTPLNAILGHAADLDEEALSAADRQKLAVVRRSAERLRGLVDDLLTHARIGEGRLALRPVPVDVSTVVMDIARAHLPEARRKGLSLLTDLTHAPPVWATDPLRLHQVLDNLVGNAVKFTREGKVDISAREEEDRLVLRVSDTGPGIAPQDQARVFERFERAASREHEGAGAGLGLAITHKLVDLLEGTLSLDSAEGRGSTFTVSLPALEVGGLSVKEDVPEEGATAGVRVLYVEDVGTNRMLMEEWARRWGWHFTTVATPGEALAHCNAHDVDLFLIDVDLGDHMRGTELALRLRGLRRFRHVPMLAVTAHADPTVAGEAYKAGMNDVVTKPIDRGRLLALAAFWTGRSDVTCAEPPSLLALSADYDHDATRLPKVLQEHRRAFAAMRADMETALAEGDGTALAHVRHKVRPHLLHLGLPAAVDRLDALTATSDERDRAAVMDVFRCCERTFLRELERLTASTGA